MLAKSIQTHFWSVFNAVLRVWLPATVVHVVVKLAVIRVSAAFIPILALYRFKIRQEMSRANPKAAALARRPTL
jgi:hypothetical protein